jgi:HrpA-like RNA helicase
MRVSLRIIISQPDQVLVFPMYSSLHPSQQLKVFTPTPHGSRKCILATNIAETSITIPGVKYVIDTGKCKERRYVAKEAGSGRYIYFGRKTVSTNPTRTGVDTLLTRDISRSSAMQRAGRAGREACVYISPIGVSDTIDRERGSVFGCIQSTPSIQWPQRWSPRFVDVT